MLIIILLFTALIAIYLYLNSIYQYWEKRGILGPKPRFFIGNLGTSILWKISQGDLYTNYYNEYKDEGVVGMYRTVTPVLMIRDPELIREVTTQSFTHFYDNDINMEKKNDPLWGRNIFVLKGEEWKLVRGQLSPGFTGSKMKWLYPHLLENAKEMVEYITKHQLHGECDAKELYMKFALENIATAVYGLKGGCFQNETSEFRQLASELFTPGNWGAITFYIIVTIPSIVKYFPLSLFTKSVTKKLIALTSDTIKHREENNIVRNDFIQIMTQLKTTCKDYKFDDLDVAAHTAGFFLDGYDTSSSILSFTLVMISINPEAQKKLRMEIQDAYNANDQKLPYDLLESLKYLDAVILETIRLYPVLPFLQKMCTKTYCFSNGLTVEQGTPIIIPAQGLSHDPKYFKNPEEFQPERFLDEQKENIVKYTFMPFGEGPRACIGKRFANLQLKLGIASVVNKFEVLPSPKMKFPLKFDPSYVMTWPLGGLHVRLRKL